MAKRKWYVSMTDKFMSGWGEARNKTNKLVFECDSYEQAVIVEQNARSRSDQKYINICSTKPYYSSRNYLVQYKTITEYPKWYEAGYFKKSA